MLVTPEQLQLLNSMLSFLRWDFKAEFTEDDGNIRVTCVWPHTGVRGDCGFTIDPSEEGDGKWSVNVAITSGGSMWEPPDVEVIEVEAPTTWECACVALVKNIVGDAMNRVLEGAGEAEAARYYLDEQEQISEDHLFSSELFFD